MSVLINPDPVYLINFFLFGYDALGELFVPGVDQSVPFLAGYDAYVQAFEFAPGAASTNGLVIPLLP